MQCATDVGLSRRKSIAANPESRELKASLRKRAELNDSRKASRSETSEGVRARHRCAGGRWIQTTRGQAGWADHESDGLDSTGVTTIDRLHKAPNVKLVALFSPEHGIRGVLDQPKIDDTVDEKTGVPVYSLYGEAPQADEGAA